MKVILIIPVWMLRRRREKKKEEKRRKENYGKRRKGENLKYNRYHSFQNITDEFVQNSLTWKLV